MVSHDVSRDNSPLHKGEETEKQKLMSQKHLSKIVSTDSHYISNSPLKPKLNNMLGGGVVVSSSSSMDKKIKNLSID